MSLAAGRPTGIYILSSFQHNISRPQASTIYIPAVRGTAVIGRPRASIEPRSRLPNTGAIEIAPVIVHKLNVNQAVPADRRIGDILGSLPVGPKIILDEAHEDGLTTQKVITDREMSSGEAG